MALVAILILFTINLRHSYHKSAEDTAPAYDTTASSVNQEIPLHQDSAEYTTVAYNTVAAPTTRPKARPQYNSTGYPALTHAAIADPTSQGMTFRLSGTATSARTTKQGLILLKVQSPNANLVIDVPIFHSLDKLKTKLGLNDEVTIVGNLGQYRRVPQ